MFNRKKKSKKSKEAAAHVKKIAKDKLIFKLLCKGGWWCSHLGRGQDFLLHLGVTCLHVFSAGAERFETIGGVLISILYSRGQQIVGVEGGGEGPHKHMAKFTSHHEVLVLCQNCR